MLKLDFFVVNNLFIVYYSVFMKTKISNELWFKNSILILT